MSTLRTCIKSGLLLTTAAGCLQLHAQERDESERTGGDGEKDEKTFAEIVAASDRHDGIFAFYRDRETGKLHMGFRPDQLGQEYVYIALTIDGVVEGGTFRGNYRDNEVISIARHFDRVEIRAENTAFYFDPASPLSRAASANVSPALLATERIVAENEETGEMLIDADGIFLEETLHQVKQSRDRDDDRDEFSLGDLSGTKSKITEIRNYPLNADVLVEYVYEDLAPEVRGDEEITDSRYVSIQVQHSFIKMPEDGYRPRFTDHRIGYFAEQVTDMTSDSPTPYRDLVKRWHLEKQDPGADLSEPVEPIVWWIENTTPLQYRDAIREGVLAWNKSFEKIGFKNALVVKVQPDDADWDAGDIRYNVLRWTSSPNPPFSGYGPSFTNPHTGQILGADIMLEHSGVIQRVRAQRILDDLGQTSWVGDAQSSVCSFGHGLQLSQVFGRFAVNALDMDPALEARVIEEFLVDLILHEVGHTLGFSHNFGASNMLDLDEVFDQAITTERGLSASVMDYTDINIPTPGREHGQFFQTTPGPYDDWVVEYSYSVGLADPEAEEERLAAIAGRSTQPVLLFGADDHVMTRPGRGTDPRILWYDLSSDPIGYAEERLVLVKDLLGKAKDKHAREGESYHELRDAYLVMLSQFARSVRVLSRYVGGVYVNRAVVGQPGAQTPFVPVSLLDQQRAMAGLATHLFAPNALSATEALYSHLQEQRRLWNFSGRTEDPKLHEWLLDIQQGVLAHLLDPGVLTRITDSRLYGNEYALADLMEDLTEAVFAEDIRGDVNTFRQNLQLDFVGRLTRIIDGEGEDGYDYPSQSMALYQLRSIQRMLRGKRSGNLETRAHTDHILYAIASALEEEA